MNSQPGLMGWIANIRDQLVLGLWRSQQKCLQY